MSYFDMFCRIACNPILYMYNNYSNVLEMALPSQFFLGVLVHQDFSLDERMNVNEQKEPRKSSNFDYRLINLE